MTQNALQKSSENIAMLALLTTIHADQRRMQDRRQASDLHDHREATGGRPAVSRLRPVRAIPRRARRLRIGSGASAGFSPITLIVMSFLLSVSLVHLAAHLPKVAPAPLKPWPDVESIAVDGIQLCPDDAKEPGEVHVTSGRIPLDFYFGGHRPAFLKERPMRCFP